MAIGRRRGRVLAVGVAVVAAAGALGPGCGGGSSGSGGGGGPGAPGSGASGTGGPGTGSVADQVQFWLNDATAARPEEALVALGAPAEPALVAALGGPTPGSLRAARALASRWTALAAATRAPLLAALPALLEAGLETAIAKRLGDAGLQALLRAPAPGPKTRATAEALWKDVPAARRGEALGAAVSIELRARDRYTLGATQGVLLVEHAPAYLSAVGKLWLRTSHVTVTGDGKEVASREWLSGHNLAAPAEVQLELGALCGAALTEEGPHELEAMFDAQIVAPAEGGRIDEAPVLWSGKLRTAKMTFEVVRLPSSDLVAAVSDPSADPAAALTIRLHAGGKAVALWPAPAAPPVLEVPAGELRGALKATAVSPLSVGLAFDVVASAGKAAGAVIGTVSVDRVEAPDPCDLATVDLTKLGASPAGVTVKLELRPSATAAYRHPGISRYWDRPIALGAFVLKTVKP
jgi:hypothetical protein